MQEPKTTSQETRFKLVTSHACEWTASFSTQIGKKESGLLAFLSIYQFSDLHPLKARKKRLVYVVASRTLREANSGSEKTNC